MDYLKFKGPWPEEQLIKVVLSSWQFQSTENFPRVKTIGRRKKIHPDIDILCIKDRTKGDVTAKLIGYETKILRSDEKGNIEWEGLYSGIGEAFFYLKFGLNQCGLILGFHDELSDRKIEEFLGFLRDERDFLNKAFSSSLSYFNFFVFLDKDRLEKIVEAGMDFANYFHNLPQSKTKEEMKKYRRLFVEKEFKWSEKIASKCKYAEKP